MKHIENHIPELSSGDISAILTALPLAGFVSFGDPVQETATFKAVERVGVKLIRRTADFTVIEFGVIYLAISLAVGYLSGHPDESLDISAIDPELKTQLSGNYFVYSRLLPYFEKAANDTEL